MKRFCTIAAAAAMTLAGPLAISTADAAPRQQQHARWNQSQYNGYYANGRFNYGAPPANVQNRRDYRPAYQNWRRGDRLPSTFRTRYREVDYRRAHLRAPPRGYHYVRDDRGETLLVGIATGVILSILASQ